MQRLVCRRDADPTIFLPPQSVTGETPVPRWLRGMAVPAMRKLDRSLPAAQGPAQANHLAWQVLSRLECFAE